MLQDLTFIGHIAVKSSMGVLLAALGELVAERAGVLNLGVEGMMLVGALTGAAVGLACGDPWLAAGTALLAGGLFSLIHAFFAVTLCVNQTLSGLALTILGMGLCNFLGRPFIGEVGVRFKTMVVPWLGDIPVLGHILFRHTPLVYLSCLLVPLVTLVLFHTRLGLKLRAVGEDAEAAHAAGVNVTLLRYGATAFGGMLAGLGGAYLSLAYTPGWKEDMTMGQGWIAIAMVIFATWHPVRAFAGALLFGGLTALQFLFQATGVEFIPIWVLKALPYLLTIAVLVITLRLSSGRGAGPAGLGRAFRREG